ncbi:hypothetical protein ACF0H5_005999 [Mactra antiquata]
MWKWLNRRRSRRRSENQDTTYTEENVDPQSPQLPHIFTRPSMPVLEMPPKCLRRFAFSDILYGERIEDYSSECWLENHLHRFGLPSNQGQIIFRTNLNPRLSWQNTLSNLEESDMESSGTGTSENNSSLVDISDLEQFNDQSDHLGMNEPVTPRPRLALEELFNPWPEINTETERNSFDFGDIILEAPPPYTESDLPPTYEEAVGQFERRSNGSRSSQGSSLAFMW